MQTYFTAIQPHLEVHVDIAIIKTNQSPSSKSILSLGMDKLIYQRNLSSEQQNRIYLSETSKYGCIAESLYPNHCILGGENGIVDDFDLQTQETKTIYKSDFKVNFLSNSPNKRYLAVGSQESKTILIDLQTLRSSKCRPGHEAGVASVSFSENQKYLASIGMDGTLYIYNIQNFQQPIQKFHFKISKAQSNITELLRGSFHKDLQIYYAPGMKQVQRIELLNNKWEHHLSKFIIHSQIIQLIKMIKVNLMITCSSSQFFIWNNRTEEKMVVIQNFTLNKILEVDETFWGCRQDGKIFCYKKHLNESLINDKIREQKHQSMELEDKNEENDDIVFDDNGIEEQAQKQEIKQDESLKEYEYQRKKKSRSDRLITAFPQQSVRTTTSQFDSARYLYTSHNGYLIQATQNEYEVRIEFEREDKSTTELLFINKKIEFSDFNNVFVSYANETEYGVKFFKSSDQKYFGETESWEKNWEDIVAIASSYHWVAVANDQEIKIVDVTGNELKTIAFDRIIVAMAAYENLLAVVYHESIPIDGCQCLAMQLYVVNNQKNQVLKCSTCHVPLKPKSNLKYFRFTNEGMLISHDDGGYIRVYNLQNNTWTSVIVQGIEDTRRIWLLGMKDYKLIYWKTSQLNPDPQVFPRLPVKASRLGTNITMDDPQRMYQYPYLMFERYCLDHEKCRSRLWSHIKFARTQKYPGYKQNIASIMSTKQIIQHHNQLDYKFFKFIKFYLENTRTHQKAVMAVKTLIRTIEAGKKFIDIFDDLKLRTLAVDLEIYFEEKEKQIQYELIQNLELQNLKQEAEKYIKPKTQNNPFNRKKNTDLSSIPSLNNSQISQTSNFDALSQRSIITPSKDNGTKTANKQPIFETQQKEQISNPYLKKKSTEEDMNVKTKEIQEQIEKYGIKKKAQIIKKSGKQF